MSSGYRDHRDDELVEAAIDVEPDPLEILVRTRGDEMSTTMRAMIHVLRIYLKLGATVGFLAMIGASVVLSVYVAVELKLGILAPVAYLGAALPATYFGWHGLRALRRKLARTIANRIERGLDAIGGIETPMMLSLRAPRRPEDER